MTLEDVICKTKPNKTQKQDGQKQDGQLTRYFFTSINSKSFVSDLRQ